MSRSESQPCRHRRVFDAAPGVVMNELRLDLSGNPTADHTVLRFRRYAWTVALVGLAGCVHTDAEMRLYCLRQAHVTVKVPEQESKNRESMVRDYYLRCLDAHGVPDAPIGSGQ
jgi:hypothetical protein